MITKNLYSIFKTGSKTYFYSSLFFPPAIKEEVFVLYSFVRKADDLVDQVPQDRKGFFAFRKEYESASKGKESKDEVISRFAKLEKARQFDPKWVKSFLDAMESDLDPPHYRTMKDSMRYMHGSAEVVGLMMARVLRLPDSSHHAARLLGRAMQYVNFIRDVSEDLQLGRCYFPKSDMRKHHLSSLKLSETGKKPENFKAFMREQIRQYLEWQEEGECGFRFIPPAYVAPIRAASEMYKWTARVIEKDPFIVYRRKVKPSIADIITTVTSNVVLCNKVYCAVPHLPPVKEA